MPPIRVGLGRMVAYVGMAGSVLLLSAALYRVAPGMSPWIKSPLLFAVAKLAGDGLLFLVKIRPEVFYFEDLIRDVILFLLLGLAVALTIEAATSIFGSPVDPALPAVVGYLAFAMAGTPRR